MKIVLWNLSECIHVCQFPISSYCNVSLDFFFFHDYATGRCVFAM